MRAVDDDRRALSLDVAEHLRRAGGVAEAVVPDRAIDADSAVDCPSGREEHPDLVLGREGVAWVGWASTSSSSAHHDDLWAVIQLYRAVSPAHRWKRNPFGVQQVSHRSGPSAWAREGRKKSRAQSPVCQRQGGFHSPL